MNAPTSVDDLLCQIAGQIDLEQRVIGLLRTDRSSLLKALTGDPDARVAVAQTIGLPTSALWGDA